MKRLLPLLLIASACASTQSAAGEHGEPSLAAAQFDKIKSLAGEWAAHASDGSDAIEVRYEVTAGGSVVEEKLYPGTKTEMVTMYHLNFDSLVLTHYCAAGNQPRMVARSDAQQAAGDKIEFAFLGASNLASPKQAHMHALTLEFVDADHFRAHWSLYRDGKPAEHADFEFARKNATTQARSIIESGVDSVLEVEDQR